MDDASVSLDMSGTGDEEDDGDDESEGRYDRRQNLRDADDLQQSLRRRLLTTQSVFFTCVFCFRCQEYQSLVVFSR